MKNKLFKIHLSPAMITLVTVITFFAGTIFRYKSNIHNSTEKMPLYSSGITEEFNGAAYSVGQIARQIEKYLHVKVPGEALNLYCAIDGNFDSDYYAALTLPTDQACKKFLEKQLGVPFDEFRKSKILPKEFIKKGPDSWSKNLKGNWDLESFKDFYICEDTGYGDQTVVYVPEHHRIFIHHD